MSPRLVDLPNEVIESIVVLLALCDICSLRQSCRTLATKTTQDHFESCFRSRHVDITGSGLQALVDMTQPGQLGCLIQHLVLVGVVNNTKLLESILEESQEEPSLEGEGKHYTEERMKAQQDLEILEQRQTEYNQLHESGADIRLLSEAFSNIAANSETGKLLSLSLDVSVYREDTTQRLPPLSGGSWKFIWQSAADTFHTALRSLAISRLTIEKLNIFNDRQLQRCSLGCNELGRIDFDDEGLAVSLASLKTLSVSFSDRVIFASEQDAEQSHDPAENIDWDNMSDSARDIDDVRAEAADEDNFMGLGRLLRLIGSNGSSQLENLDLHQYTLKLFGLTHADLYRESLLQRTVVEMEMDSATQASQQNLKRIELRGVYVTEGVLLAFLQQMPGVRKIFMDNICMSSGTFRSIFDYCTSDGGDVEELYFHELFEGELRVYFDGPADAALVPPLIPFGPGGSDTLERVGVVEVRQQISYRSFLGDMVGSPAKVAYLQQRRREYGPPWIDYGGWTGINL